MRIGVLGGTFDPIHLAHLIVAEEARVSLGLEEVVFIPTGEPWLKAGLSVSQAQHRLNMVRLAIASNPFFRASSLEIDRPGPSYTIDTLEAIAAEIGNEAEIFFILGVDSLEQFLSWKEPVRVLELATLVAVSRPCYKKFDPFSLDQLFSGASQRVVALDGPSIDISGRELRRRVGQGLSIRYQVCGTVAHYIMEHGLYLDGREGH